MTWDLRLGSCLDPLTGLASLADGSVDVTITDPPYEAEAHAKGMRTKKDIGSSGPGVVSSPLPFAAITQWDRMSMAREICRVTRRWILVFCQVEASPLWRMALEAGDAEYIRTMVWVKPDAQPQLTGDRPGMGYESIVVAHRPGRKRWNGGGKCGVFDFNKNGRHGAAGAPHPTTKPLPLMRELVSLFSNPGETVLDVCAGSGSTGVACNQLGRNFLGWELDETYFGIAQRRLNGDEARPQPEQPGLFDVVTA